MTPDDTTPAGENAALNTPSEQALADVLEAFRDQWGIIFTVNGRAALKRRFDDTLGRYLRGIEVVNRGVDIWGDAYLKEMPAFILGYVVAEMAFEIRRDVPDPTTEISVDETTIDPIADMVMKGKKTTDYCQFVVTSYQRKLKLPKDHTPICGDVRPLPD
jgi:hypothetical protein